MDSPNLAFLTEEELVTYERFKKARRPSLTEDVAETLYEIFATGKSCKEIWVLNQTLLPGSIIEARVDFNWDNRRIDHEKVLESSIKSKALNTQANTLQFVGDILNIVKISQQEAMDKYLETKDPIHLQGIIKVDSAKDLKLLVEIFQMLAAPVVAPVTNQNPGNTLVYNQQNIQVPASNAPIQLPAIDVNAHTSFLTTSARDKAKEERDKAETAENRKKLKERNGEEN